jgi:hypothetical protein
VAYGARSSSVSIALDVMVIGSKDSVFASNDATRVAQATSERVYLNIDILNGCNNLCCEKNEN